eukprot:TRINITY_DN9937_c0_g2_i20.p1 TRINITY_DN9937_c0_g2~~TRINITY_DN9937_c0_g2_i20.p1  ORF type:complete len:404 (-),score=106.00 TRINITY_DN9937_c0_g2_i20:300-1511(-)
MEEIMVELLSYIDSLDSEEYTREVSGNIYKAADFIVQKVSRRRGLSDREYAKAMQNYLDPKYEAALALAVEKRLQGHQRGKATENIFTCDQRYSKELSIDMLRWILLADVYVDYREAFLLLRGSESVSKRQFDELRKANAPKKVARRAIILKRKFKDSEYFHANNELKRAFCKYRLEDKDFDESAGRLLRLCGILEELTCEKQVVPEFQRDPYDLRFEEVSGYCEKMELFYINCGASSSASKVSEMFDKNLLATKEDERVHGKEGAVLSFFQREDSIVVENVVRPNKSPPRKESTLKDAGGPKNTEETKKAEVEEFKDLNSSDDELIMDSEEEIIKEMKAENNKEDDKSEETSQTEKTSEKYMHSPAVRVVEEAKRQEIVECKSAGKVPKSCELDARFEGNLE